jgi:[acyl-carrier-protein] S-malonyltransferase
MVSILGLELAQVEELCDAAEGDEFLVIANYLCPGNFVVSGTKAACERAVELAPKMGAMRALRLNVAGAFHTSIMQPAVERLIPILRGVEFKPPKVPFISNADARPHDDPKELRQLLYRQVIRPVRWEDSMRYLLDVMAIESFYEIGPGTVLRGLLKRINRRVPCESVGA